MFTVHCHFSGHIPTARLGLDWDEKAYVEKATAQELYSCWCKHGKNHKYKHNQQ